MFRASRWSGFPKSRRGEIVPPPVLPRPPTLVAPRRLGMALWRENSESAMEFFKLQTNRVIELGSQVEI
jgi:hypothetical protein